MADLRYRNARDTADRLGQVYTPPAIASLLAESISLEPGCTSHLLDLGAGRGALASAILEKHQQVTATLVEIDSAHIKALRRNAHPRTSIVQADVLGDQWSCTCTPGTIVSNPPYSSLRASPGLTRRIENSQLGIPFNGFWVRGDAAFAATAWAAAQVGTKLGLIVASPIVRNASYRAVRERFVNELRGLCVTQLDAATFQNAEVSTFIITGQRAVRRNRRVLLRKASADGSVCEVLEVSREEAISSLDIDFHLALRRIGQGKEFGADTVGSLGTVITRGSRSQNEFGKLGLQAFHTSDFPEQAGSITLLGNGHEVFHVAKPGDILIPRVGSRCLVRQARVHDGYGLFTDCVYRLVVSRHARARVWKTINSAFGAEWRVLHAEGSCAKHLSIQSLLAMPIIP